MPQGQGVKVSTPRTRVPKPSSITEGGQRASSIFEGKRSQWSQILCILQLNKPTKQTYYMTLWRICRLRHINLLNTIPCTEFWICELWTLNSRPVFCQCGAPAGLRAPHSTSLSPSLPSLPLSSPPLASSHPLPSLSLPSLPLEVGLLNTARGSGGAL